MTKIKMIISDETISMFNQIHDFSYLKFRIIQILAYHIE